MKVIKKILKWSLILFAVWLSYQGLVYGYWLYRGWNDSDLAIDIDEHMKKLPSDELYDKITGFHFTIADPYRDSAWKILIERKYSRIVPLLIEELESWNWFTRVTAMRALGEIGDKRAIEPLMEIVRRSEIDYSYSGSRTPDYIVALEALAKMKYEPAYKYAVKLATLKKDPNDFRAYGITMLEYFKDPKALSILEGIAAKDPEKYIRKKAKRAIQRIKSARN